jgi:hypothetical protein
MDMVTGVVAALLLRENHSRQLHLALLGEDENLRRSRGGRSTVVQPLVYGFTWC